MSNEKLKKKFKLGRGKLDVPSKVLVSIFFLAAVFIVFLAYSSPKLYEMFTESTFEEAIFVEKYKDRLSEYGTHPQLRSVQVDSSAYTISTSKAGRTIDEVNQVYRDGKRSVMLLALLMGIFGGTALAVLLIYGYAKKEHSHRTRVASIALVSAFILLNWVFAFYHSHKDKNEYQLSQPFIRGSLAVLNYVAIQQNTPDLLKELLSRDVPVDAVDNQRGGYMHHVAELNRVEMFKELILIFTDKICTCFTNAISKIT